MKNPSLEGFINMKIIVQRGISTFLVEENLKYYLINRMGKIE